MKKAKTMESIVIIKNEVDEVDFENALYLYNCRLIDEDDDYYYVEGDSSDLDELMQTLNSKGW